MGAVRYTRRALVLHSWLGKVGEHDYEHDYEYDYEHE